VPVPGQDLNFQHHFVPVPGQDLNFQRHISWPFFSSVN
jgi:hypothetical protein